MTEYKVRVKELNIGKEPEKGFVPFGNIQYQDSGREETPLGLQMLTGEFIGKINPALISGKTLEVTVKLS